MVYVNVSMKVKELKVNIDDDLLPKDFSDQVATLDAGDLGDKRLSIQLTLDMLKKLAMDTSLAVEAIERGDTNG